MNRVIMILSLCSTSLWAAFSIEESGKSVVSISDNGTFEATSINENATTTPSDGDNVLLFEKEGDVADEVDAAVWITSSGEVQISQEYKSNTAIPAGGFSFESSQHITAAVGLDKNLYTLQGKSSLEQIVSYVGTFAVFESGIDGLSTLSYENFAEGQISHDGIDTQRRYYVKDHLGTPRVVLQEDAENTVELTQHYHSYGRLNAISQNNVGATSVREGYIGLEFDTDGETNDGLASGIRLNYHNARYLDNDIGMFTAVDPLHELTCGFAYTNNPVVSFDSNGKWITMSQVIDDDGNVHYNIHLTASLVRGNGGIPDDMMPYYMDIIKDDITRIWSSADNITFTADFVYKNSMEEAIQDDPTRHLFVLDNITTSRFDNLAWGMFGPDAENVIHVSRRSWLPSSERTTENILYENSSAMFGGLYYPGISAHEVGHLMGLFDNDYGVKYPSYGSARISVFERNIMSDGMEVIEYLGKEYKVKNNNIPSWYGDWLYGNYQGGMFYQPVWGEHWFE